MTVDFHPRYDKYSHKTMCLQSYGSLHSTLITSFLLLREGLLGEDQSPAPEQSMDHTLILHRILPWLICHLCSTENSNNYLVTSVPSLAGCIKTNILTIRGAFVMRDLRDCTLYICSLRTYNM